MLAYRLHIAKLFQYLTILFLFFFVSCSTVVPSADFWLKFRSNEIRHKHFDHGPYGGNSEVLWVSKNNRLFTAEEIKQFAQEHGWRFINQINFPNKLDTGFSNSIIKNKFGAKNLQDKIILQFETDFLTILEDDELSTNRNGFAILTKSADSCIIYYRWGDF